MRRFREVWTLGSLRDPVADETGVRISTSEVHAILRCGGLSPHRAVGWLHSPDAEFAARSKRVAELYIEAARARLHERGLTHLRVTTRHPCVTIDKGAEDDPWPCARLRRDTVHLWILEVADRNGRWSTTHVRGLMDDLLCLVDQFGWIVAPVPVMPLRTSKTQH